MERKTKATTKQNGTAFAMVELQDDGEWMVMANTDGGLAIDYYDDTGQDAENVLKTWLAEVRG